MHTTCKSYYTMVVTNLIRPDMIRILIHEKLQIKEL